MPMKMGCNQSKLPAQVDIEVAQVDATPVYIDRVQVGVRFRASQQELPQPTPAQAQGQTLLRRHPQTTSEDHPQNKEKVSTQSHPHANWCVHAKPHGLVEAGGPPRMGLTTSIKCPWVGLHGMAMMNVNAHDQRARVHE